MSKQKQNITREDLIDYYMDAVVAHQGRLFTIEDLAEKYNFESEHFEEYFESFEALNKAIFKVFIDNALEVIWQSADFDHFSKKDRLLSLYYTLFENLTLNRDFVLLTINSYGLNLSALPLLSEMKESFIAFIDSLQMETLSITATLESFQKKSLQEGLWIQFLLTLKFWMSDHSSECEKTDIFIEKSINTGLELLNTQSLNNVIDLGKFLYNERIKTKGN